MAPSWETSTFCSGKKTESPEADVQEERVIPPSPRVAAPKDLTKSLLFVVMIAHYLRVQLLEHSK
jgi:hypothetical protein